MHKGLHSLLGAMFLPECPEIVEASCKVANITVFLNKGHDEILTNS